MFFRFLVFEPSCFVVFRLYRSFVSLVMTKSSKLLKTGTSNAGTSLVVKSRVSDHLPFTHVLGHSCITDDRLSAMAEKGWFNLSKAQAPKSTSRVLKAREGYVVVFSIFFEAGLRFPCSSFVADNLDLYSIEI
uniref:Uncharacterized protein n=1 Tax=Arundo donax TaxID=35708 RepID=A0A0A9DN35_ARUDO